MRAALTVQSLSVSLLVAILWFVLCRHLSSEWSLNEQYNYGWFVPFFAVYLFWLRWECRPDPQFPISNFEYRILAAFALLALLLLLPIRLFEVANPDWRPLGWVHAAIVVAITLCAIWRIGGLSWMRYFAFTISFIFVAVPWVSAIEAPMVQGLMSTIASAAAETISLFGIPAQVQGNLIRLPSGVVGVSEACSGVRSLQTSIMIGLLFGELKRLSTARRFALVGAAVAIALFANFLRAVFLVTIAAQQNIEAVGKWHDIAGYAIVGVVFAGTLALAELLGKRGSKKQQVEKSSGARTLTFEPSASASHPSQPALRISHFAFLLPLLFLLGVEAGVEGWYRVHEGAMTHASRWTVAWPKQAPAFREMPIDEGVRSTLRFDEGRQATWTPLLTSSANQTPGERCILYFFRWNPGGSSVVRARAHRPDICLPAAGWRQQGEGRFHKFEVGPHLTLPFRQFDFVNTNGATTAHTFFCLQEDRLTHETRDDLAAPEGTQPDWSFPARWNAVRNGVRNMGQQVMELVVLNTQPTLSESAAADVARMLPALVQSQD